MSIDTIKGDDNLELVFSEIGGFGIYQIYLLILLCIPCTMSSFFMDHFLFASATLDYR